MLAPSQSVLAGAENLEHSVTCQSCLFIFLFVQKSEQLLACVV